MGVGDGLGSMTYCSPWGRKELDTTERLSMVSVCLPSDAFLQHLPSYLGFSYLGHGYLFTGAPAKCSQCSFMTNLNSILKSRYITLLTKAHIVKAMVFPVVKYRCWSWTITKAECRRIDAFNCGVGEDS